jgi:hypothetical protein
VKDNKPVKATFKRKVADPDFDAASDDYNDDFEASFRSDSQ